MNQATIYIGCAGWSLNAQVATHFPIVGTHLQRYAQVFSAVEINTSFYREHQAKTYARWAQSVPDHFLFSVKLPRAITHVHRLVNVQPLVERFVEQTAALEKKLGCVLVQLPPSLAFDPIHADTFFIQLRSAVSAAIVCEPRHESWFGPEARALLTLYDIDYVRAHPKPVPKLKLGSPRSTLYIRLHGVPVMYYSAYSADYLNALAQRIRAVQADGYTIWCVFDNTAQGYAVPNALHLIDCLAGHQAGES